MMLGTGASLAGETFPRGASGALFLTTIGSETAEAIGTSFSATTDAAGLDESSPALALVG